MHMIFLKTKTILQIRRK